jgi:ubiquitin
MSTPNQPPDSKPAGEEPKAPHPKVEDNRHPSGPSGDTKPKAEGDQENARLLRQLREENTQLKEANAGLQELNVQLQEVLERLEAEVNGARGGGR